MILKNTSLNFYTYKVKDFEDCEFYETLTFDKVVFNENKSKILDLEFNNTKFKRLHIHGINFEKGLIFLKKSATPLMFIGLYSSQRDILHDDPALSRIIL